MYTDGQIMCVEQCTDVISSVSRSSKSTKIVGSWGFAAYLTGGAYSAPPEGVAGFNRAYF